MIETTYLALGTNLGKKKKNLEQAIDMLNNVGSVKKISKIYKYPSMGFDGYDFYNCCVELHTELSPLDLLKKCQTIEQEMGRVKTISEGYENRIIDIDIIYYGNKVYTSKELNIPHKEAMNRSFVVFPLLDISPELVDPKSGVTVKIIAEKFKGNDIEVAEEVVFDGSF